MARSLSVIGLIWAGLSFISATISCLGYFMPYWLSGGSTSSSTGASFGTFRYCSRAPITADSYRSLPTTANSPLLAIRCRRYSSFDDIPTVWWQATTVIAGIGCCVGLLVSFMAIACCCVSDVMSRTVACAACIVQLLAGLFLLNFLGNGAIC